MSKPSNVNTAVLVKIQKDEQAGVWVGVGVNLDGLVAEAATMDELHGIICVLIPEVVQMNGLPRPLEYPDEEQPSQFWTLPVHTIPAVASMSPAAGLDPVADHLLPVNRR